MYEAKGNSGYVVSAWEPTSTANYSGHPKEKDRYMLHGPEESTDSIKGKWDR